MNKKWIIGLVFLAVYSGIWAQQPKPKAPKTQTPAAVKKPQAPKSQAIPPRTREKIYYVNIITDFGTIRIGLFNETPQHRDNFIQLIKSGFYDSLLFHRVIAGFMIQGGDPLSKFASPGSPLGMGDNGYRIPAEIVPGIYHKRGALAAARDQNPEKASSGCQFYIVQGKKMTPKELEAVINGKNMNKKMEVFKKVMESDTVKARLDDFKLRGDNAGLEQYMKDLQPVVDRLFAPFFFDPDPLYVQLYTSVGGTPHLDFDYTVFGEVVSGMEVVDAIAASKTDGTNRPLQDIRMKIVLVNP